MEISHEQYRKQNHQTEIGTAGACQAVRERKPGVRSLLSTASPHSDNPPITAYRYSMQHGPFKESVGPETLGKSAYRRLLKQGKIALHLIHFDRPDDDGSLREVTKEDWENLCRQEEQARATGDIMQMLRERMQEKSEQ